MNTNSRLGRILPATGATVFLLAMGSMRAVAAGRQGETDPSPFVLTQPQTKPDAPTPAPMRGATKYVGDAVVTAKVKAVLFKDEALKSLKIHVETRKGVVRLSGDVVSPIEAARAVHDVRALSGVKLVMSDLQVRG